MTEQNYVDPGQDPSNPAPATTTSAMLVRIGDLERRVDELEAQLALAQGGLPTPTVHSP